MNFIQKAISTQKKVISSLRESGLSVDKEVEKLNNIIDCSESITKEHQQLLELLDTDSGYELATESTTDIVFLTKEMFYREYNKELVYSVYDINCQLVA